MIVDLWSFEPLNLSLRGSFELDAFPNGDYHTFFEDQMRSLGVFRFGCSDVEAVPYAVIIKKENPEPIELPFTAYHSSCAIDDTDLKIINWPNDRPEGKALHEMMMEHPIMKDDKAWFRWNIKVDVLQVSMETIKTKEVEGASERLVANNRVESL